MSWKLERLLFVLLYRNYSTKLFQFELEHKFQLEHQKTRRIYEIIAWWFTLRRIECIKMPLFIVMVILSFLSAHSFILLLLSFSIFDLYMHMIRQNWRSKKWMRWKRNGLTIKEHVKWSLQSKECMKKHENCRKQRIYTLSLKREREQKKIVCGLFKSHCSRIKFE